MATGWAGDGAVQDQIDATVEDAVKRARSRMRKGPSLSHCEECDAPIPPARREAVPGVRREGERQRHLLPAEGEAPVPDPPRVGGHHEAAVTHGIGARVDQQLLAVQLQRGQTAAGGSRSSTSKSSPSAWAR